MSEEIVTSESYSPSGNIATVEPIEEETLEIGEEDGLLLGDDDEGENRRGGTVDPVSRFVDGNEEGEITIPYEYPTGVIHIDQFDMLPMMNAYERWTATPGMTGEPLDSFTLLLKFEGMGAQDLTVGLAHKQGGKGKGMYQLIIGNKGNLQVDLEKRRGKGGKTVASAAGLLCASNKAHKYWIAVKNGRIDFGVGDTCGQHTVLSYQDPEDPVEVRFVGFTCLRHRALFRNITMEAVTGGPMGDLVETNLEFTRAEGCDEGFSGEDKAALDSALELYKRECENMKRRARKFGGAYKPPFLQDWVPWTLVKRLSWNRDLEGGIDRESKEERQKRKLRAERFGVGGGSVEVAAEALRSKAPLAGSVDPDTAELMTEEKRFARSQKFSIPDQMWRIQAEEQDLQPADIFCQDPDRADPEPMATTFPHKIHIFSFDKAVCKQIRDNDVKAYFEGFGPKYVEWLSDWSFNVVFEDAEEAKNAAGAKSFGLPEALPRELAEAIGEDAVVDMGSMGWRLGVPMCKIMEDRHGPKGQWVRLLLRCAEEQDILLERPKTPLKPQGPIPRRLTGKNKLPPAVRVAQGLSSRENEGGGKRRPGIGGDGGNGNRLRRGGGGVKKKRSRGDDEDARDVILGQALKSSRTSNRRKPKPRETKGLEDRAEAGMTETESGGASLVGLSVPLSLREDADASDAGTR